MGIASLCMDLSSEMIHSLLPVFLVSTLGVSAVAVGLIEGIAEATASISKIFSGALSDRARRRKPLIVAGYGLAALTKPLFPLATTASWVLGARFADRIGKGIRGAPRDALIADVTPTTMRGAAYGLRQSLDTVGAFLGPLAAIWLMFLLADDVRTVFWIAAIPAFVTVAVLAWGIDEPAQHVADASPRELPRWHDFRKLPGAFWSVTTIAGVFALARFSEAFLVLRAHEGGLPFAWTPLALVVMNLTYLASAYPAGRVADRVDRLWLLIAGTSVLIVADLILAFGEQWAVTLLGIALWGIHMGLTQGLLSAMVADAAPGALRGTAFGVFHFITGCAALISSLLAGVSWSLYGPRATFFIGGAFAAATLCGLLWWRLRHGDR